MIQVFKKIKVVHGMKIVTEGKAVQLRNRDMGIIYIYIYIYNSVGPTWEASCTNLSFKRENVTNQSQF